jgi:hypothetical protein
MTDKCAWIINFGQNDNAAKAAAMQLAQYGLTPKGQTWATGRADEWLPSAHEAAQQNTAVVILTGPAAALADPAVRRDLALFRLVLQTQRRSTVNGLSLLAGDHETPAQNSRLGLLDDWLEPADARWAARAVARAHAPVAPKWPVRLGLHAQERIGNWLEIHPTPDETASGALVGVSGNEASISFHAVGAAGALPERSVNEYELQGITFEVGERAFTAWGLQNQIATDQSYYVRIEGKPDVLAIGDLPGGQLEDVTLISIA